MAAFDTVIRHGTVATASDTYRADVGIKHGRIVAIGEILTDAKEIVDATGLLVLPGGIDSHVHIAQPSGPGIVMADDFESATRAAAFGGNTFVMPYCLQAKGQPIRAALKDYHALAENNCHIDHSFHLIISDPSEAALGQELPALVADGYTSLKIFMTYEDLALSDLQILQVLAVARESGALVQVHAENYDAIRFLVDRLERDGKVGPYFHVSGNRTISYPDIMQRIAKVARGFASLGVSADAPVAMMLRNDFALFETAFGAGALGARVVPVNWHLKGEEVSYILADSGAKLLVCHADLLPQIVNDLPNGFPLLIVRTPPEIAAAYDVPEAATIVPPGMTDFDVWREQQAPIDNPAKRALTMFYTSGTTGRPKGVKRAPMTPEQAAASERVGAIAYGLKANDDQIILMNGPMYHSAPSSYGMMAFRQGSTIILEPRFDPEELLQMIEKYRITNMHMVPTMFVRLLRLPDDVKARYDLSSLRNIIHGAAPCPVHVKQAMIAWWGLVINEYLGSTETGVPIWHSSEEALKKPGTVGRVIEGGVVKIFDAEGRECPVNVPGEIYMRQTSVPDFDYHGRPEARAEAGREGLISVGDVGYLDGDGYLFMCDRKRDMVISGGVNIYPAEIENTLIGMDGVRDCAVFGVPDDEFGERLIGCIELDDGAALTPAAIQAWLRQRLANFKVPKEIHFHDALPRESSGKIFKRKLRDQYRPAVA